MVGHLAWLVHASLAFAMPAEASQTASPTLAPQPVASGVAISTLFLRLDGLRFDALARALELRAPALTVEAADRSDLDTRGLPFAHALVHLKTGSEATWDVALILDNGDAYFRQVDAAQADAPRVVATTLVTLLHAIAANRIAPDATRVQPSPAGQATSVPDQRSTNARANPRLTVGVLLQGGVVAGLGPPTDVSALVGGGGSLGFEVRGKQGAYGAVDLRMMGRASHAHTLLRFRVAFAAGYGLQVGAFELVTAGFVTAEPWWLRHDATGVVLRQRESNGRVSPWLVGGGARVVPAWLIDVATGLQLRLGLRVELMGSAMPRGGTGRVFVADAEGSLVPRFRLGGCELATGLELGLRWQVRAKRKAGEIVQ